MRLKKTTDVQRLKLAADPRPLTAVLLLFLTSLSFFRYPFFREVNIMPRTIEVVYEDGVFKPLDKIPAREHQKFRIVYSPLKDDRPSSLLKAAEKGGSFNFLKEKEEDIYTAHDGEEV